MPINDRALNVRPINAGDAAPVGPPISLLSLRVYDQSRALYSFVDESRLCYAFTDHSRSLFTPTDESRQVMATVDYSGALLTVTED